MHSIFNLSHVLSGSYQNVSHLTNFVMSLQSAHYMTNSNKREENGNMVYQKSIGSAKTFLSILFTLNLSINSALIVDFYTFILFSKLHLVIFYAYLVGINNLGRPMKFWKTKELKQIAIIFIKQLFKFQGLFEDLCPQRQEHEERQEKIMCTAFRRWQLG